MSDNAEGETATSGPDVCARHIALMGLMGCGKSTVSRVLSQQLSRPCIDLDVAVWERSGRTVQQLFAEEGEAGFRRLETEVLESLLSSSTSSVIALGGGAVLVDKNRVLLGDAVVVWLRASVATLAARVGSGAGRPLLAGGAIERLTILEQERREIYATTADFVIDVDELRPTQVADGIRALIGGSTGLL